MFMAVVILGGLIFLSKPSSGQYDEFSQCLTNNGAKMYGAYWCPHCNSQKSMFGNSFDKIDYIECSLPGGNGQNQVCNNAGIQSYPTWEFNNGQRQTGVLSLQQLSQLTGCPL